jgi:hypothetical protein
MSKVVDLNDWRRQVEANKLADFELQGASSVDEKWALDFSWETNDALYGASEVSSYLRVPLRTFEQALRDMEAKQAQELGE